MYSPTDIIYQSLWHIRRTILSIRLQDIVCIVSLGGGGGGGGGGGILAEEFAHVRKYYVSSFGCHKIALLYSRQEVYGETFRLLGDR